MAKVILLYIVTDIAIISIILLYYEILMSFMLQHIIFSSFETIKQKQVAFLHRPKRITDGLELKKWSLDDAAHSTKR